MNDSKKRLSDGFTALIEEFSEPQAAAAMKVFLSQRIELYTDYECDLIYNRLHDIFKDPITEERKIGNVFS